MQAPQIPEGNSGSTTPLVFTIVLDNPAKAGDNVQVSTSGAEPGVDYVPLTNQSVPLVPGQLTTPVTVTVNGDDRSRPTRR